MLKTTIELKQLDLLKCVRNLYLKKPKIINNPNTAFRHLVLWVVQEAMNMAYL